MKRTGSCVLSTVLLLGSATLAMAGAYGEEEVTTEAPTAPAAPAAAATETAVETRFDRTGGYLQVGGVYVLQMFDNGADLGGVELDDADDTGGYEIRAGYRMNRWMAFEAEWEQYLHYTNVNTRSLVGVDAAAQCDPTTGSGCGANLDQWTLTVNGKFYPITGRFQPYGLVGIGAGKVEFDAADIHLGTDGKIDEAGFVMKFGLGLDLYIMENFGLAFEAGYVLPFNDMHEFDVIPFSGSLFYIFG